MIRNHNIFMFDMHIFYIIIFTLHLKFYLLYLINKYIFVINKGYYLLEIKLSSLKIYIY